jgi:nucleoside-diphosphate-sugar epimerase
VRIIITGGKGNLGGRLAARLVERGDEVMLFDVHDQAKEELPAAADCRTVIGDISRRDSLFEAVGGEEFDSVFHLAAILSADAEEDALHAWSVNMEGTRNVLDAAVKFGIGRVVFTSTVASFGSNLPEPVSVDAPQWPESLYGVSKVAGERLGVYYHHRFGLDFRGLRLPAVMAPNGAGGGASAYCSQLYVDAVRHGAYEFYLKPSTGAAVIYIDDAVRALLGIHDAEEGNLRRRVYQVHGVSPSAEEMAAEVLERMPEVRFTYKADPARDAIVQSWPFTLDDAESARDWGWRAELDLAAMTERILAALTAEG